MTELFQQVFQSEARVEMNMLTHLPIHKFVHVKWDELQLLIDFKVEKWLFRWGVGEKNSFCCNFNLIGDLIYSNKWILMFPTCFLARLRHATWGKGSLVTFRALCSSEASYKTGGVIRATIRSSNSPPSSDLRALTKSCNQVMINNKRRKKTILNNSGEKQLVQKGRNHNGVQSISSQNKLLLNSDPH